MSLPARIIRFTHYYGHDFWIDTDRVVWVRDGGCGSLGVSTEVRLDTGETVSLSGGVEDIARQIAQAKEHTT